MSGNKKINNVKEQNILKVIKVIKERYSVRSLNLSMHINICRLLPRIMGVGFKYKRLARFGAAGTG